MPRWNQSLEERFWAKVKVSNDQSCWEWQGQTCSQGYGKFYVDSASRCVVAHRVAFVIAGGGIPDGLELDHLCMNPKCVNPAHLEPVSRAENMHRRAALQTHCKSGHEFTTGNTYHRGSGSGLQRACRACAAVAAQRYRTRKSVSA